MLNRDSFYYLLSILQNVLLVLYLPGTGKGHAELLKPCLTSDVSVDGVVQALTPQWVDLSISEKCTLPLPKGLLLTKTQFFIVSSPFVFFSLSILLNIGYYFVYSVRAFDKYKVQKDKPWPWDDDPVKWAETKSKATKGIVINGLFVNIFCMLLTSWFYNW